MQRLHFFLCLLTGALTSFSSAALAKPPPYVKQDSEDQKEKPKGKKSRTQNERSSPNQDWQWGAGARLGSMVAPLSGLGVEGYKILTHRDRLGLLIAVGRADFRDVLEDEDGILIDQAEVSSSVIMVHGRRFFGETFSMAYGLGQRNISLELAASAIGTDDSIATTLHVSSVAAYAAIGNIWQWDSGFYLGCD